MTEFLSEAEQPKQEQPTKCMAELVAIQMPVIRSTCPNCKNEGLVPGAPFGSPERIAVFAQGKSIIIKCGKCGALLELEQQMISTITTHNRHEKRAAIKLAK